MFSSVTSAIVCSMIATVAVIEAAIYVGTWYGFASLVLALCFGVAAGILFRQES
jgi:uncharacterized membrane protein YadS